MNANVYLLSLGFYNTTEEERLNPSERRVKQVEKQRQRSPFEAKVVC